MNSFESRKLAVIQYLLSLKDEQSIIKFETLISEDEESEEQKTDWFDVLPETVRKSYEQGMKDIEEGKVLSVEEMLKKMSPDG